MISAWWSKWKVTVSLKSKEVIFWVSKKLPVWTRVVNLLVWEEKWAQLSCHSLKCDFLLVYQKILCITFFFAGCFCCSSLSLPLLPLDYFIHPLHRAFLPVWQSSFSARTENGLVNVSCMIIYNQLIKKKKKEETSAMTDGRFWTKKVDGSSDESFTDGYFLQKSVYKMGEMAASLLLSAKSCLHLSQIAWKNVCRASKLQTNVWNFSKKWRNPME